MVRKKRYLVLISLIFLVAIVGVRWQQVLAQIEDPQYFPETGHWVEAEFLTKYYEISNPTILYGAPITEAFVDSFGIKVQYFEKVRFELDPSLPIGIQVKISPLGEFLYQEAQPLVVPSNSRACRSFTGSDHLVCYNFLDFFEENGGVSQFGIPISGFEIHNGWIVQYFQKARFEWHPENSPGQWVTVSNLGVRYFYESGEDSKRLSPVRDGDNTPFSPPLRLRPKAFVSSAVLPTGETQTIYVIVQDQNLRPVPGAEVEFKVTLPDGSVREYRPGNTNQSGVSTLDFSVDSEIIGIANIDVSVTYNFLRGQTLTSFQIWW